MSIWSTPEISADADSIRKTEHGFPYSNLNPNPNPNARPSLEPNLGFSPTPTNHNPSFRPHVEPEYTQPYY